MQKELLKVALIGVGSVGKKYARMITAGEVPNMKLSAVVIRRDELIEWGESLVNTDGDNARIFRSAEEIFETVNLYETARSTVQMLEISAQKHSIIIDVTGSDVNITADKQMLEELIYNLCDNAIRYNNPGGKVKVSVYTRQNNGVTENVLEVADNGIGIPKEHQDRIFERFYRVDKSRSKETGGTGLGLAIVKHIVELHDARIYLESEVDKGTQIRIEF